MTTGKVKFFNANKGFGFITPDDGGQDVFVHISKCEASGCPPLQSGDTVSFEDEMGRKGPQVTNITLVSS